jgi:hypothetical protein
MLANDAMSWESTQNKTDAMQFATRDDAERVAREFLQRGFDEDPALLLDVRQGEACVVKVRWVACFRRAGGSERDRFIITNKTVYSDERYGYINASLVTRGGNPLWFDTKEEAEDAARKTVATLWEQDGFVSYAKARKYRRR